MLKCENFKKTKRKDVTFHKLCDIIVVNKYGTISETVISFRKAEKGI